MREFISSIEGEYRRYKSLGEGALRQVREDELSKAGPGDGNSIAVIVWHLSGNLRSRFTDLLTTDGEKPWRKRDEEFEPRAVTYAELLERWNEGWKTVLATLGELTDSDLSRTVTIRGVGSRLTKRSID